MTDKPAILVTGGAGYIGAHACRALDAAGCQPIVYDDLSTGHRSFVRGPLVIGNLLLDKAKLARVFSQHEIAAVMHFAAASLVGESMSDPQKYYINNVAGTLSLLEAMHSAGCRRIVFSSTGAVYGNADSKALPEDYPCAPINTYGATKWMIERMLADYRSAYGFGAFCLRYFNASGADASGGIGELRDNETHLIPRAMMALQGHLSDFAVFGDDYDTPDGTAIRDYIHVTDLAAAHVAALKLLLQGHLPGFAVFGDDYETPDGTAIRDYIHVTDLAAAHVAALKLLLEGHAGGAFNLGTGTGYSVREILDAIADETGRAVPHVVKPRRPGDPAHLVADVSAARKVLDFAPAHSDLPTIIRTAWAWHQQAHPRKAA